MLKKPAAHLFLVVLTSLIAACDQAPPEEKPVQQAANFAPQLPDFAAIMDVKEKKQTFFSYLQPMIKHANSQVLAERRTIEQWQQSQQVAPEEQQQLVKLLKKYRVNEAELAQQLNALLLKVNVIPPSLILAQAANESAWGTSRFARQGNNLFGQWCFSKGCGLVPSSRNSGASHEVAKFETPYHSVASYIRNLNSHPSYAELRTFRHEELETNGYTTGMNLAAGLMKYSERGEEYVKEIRAMIRHNKLAALDSTGPGQKHQG